MKGAIDKHGIGNNSNPQTKRDHFRSLDLYSFEYDRNVIFPVGTGDFNIDGFSMKLYQGYQNFTLTSNDIQITIKPLPSNPPADFIGAVGRFDIDRIVEDNGLKQGDVFKMKIIVSGAGNLQNITEPRPILPKGFVIYGDPIIEESFNYTSNGAEGEISFEYNVQVSKYGDINLPATSISYFDTNKEKYVSVSSEEDNRKVKEDKNFVLQETELDENESIEELNILDDLRPSEVIASTDSYYGTSLFWGGVGAPILAALLFLFITKRKENSQQELEEKQDIINQVNVIGQAVSELKVLAVSDNRYEFFSKTEYILLTAMKVLAKQSGVEYSGRADLLSHLEKSGEIELKNSINKILQQCDESRFALSSNQTELTEILKEVEQNVQRFNS